MPEHNRFTIKGRLPSLNDYTKANRSNAYAGASMKKKAERSIIEAIVRDDVHPVHSTIILNCKWYEENNKRDQDNVTFAQKFILDAMTAFGIIVDDSRKYVIGSKHIVLTDKKNPRIEVEIEEVENGKEE